MKHVEMFFAEGGAIGSEGSREGSAATAWADTYSEAIDLGDARLDSGEWTWFKIEKRYVHPSRHPGNAGVPTEHTTDPNFPADGSD